MSDNSSSNSFVSCAYYSRFPDQTQMSYINCREKCCNDVSESITSTCCNSRDLWVVPVCISLVILIFAVLLIFIFEHRLKSLFKRHCRKMCKCCSSSNRIQNESSHRQQQQSSSTTSRSSSSTNDSHIIDMFSIERNSNSNRPPPTFDELEIDNDPTTTVSSTSSSSTTTTDEQTNNSKSNEKSKSSKVEQLIDDYLPNYAEILNKLDKNK